MGHNFSSGLRHTVAVRNRITHLNFPREIYVRCCRFGVGRPPVRHTYPARVGEIPTSDKAGSERTGIAADTRETTRTKMAQMNGLDSKIIVLWSSRIYLRLVHSLIFSVDAFSGWITNMLNLEIFFGFMVHLSVALLHRGKLPCTRRTSK